jgi:uncharacterized protein (DUF885 family)
MFRSAHILVMVMYMIGSVDVAAQTPGKPQNNEDQQLRRILDEEWEYGLREYPTFATYVGDPRYNDRLSDISMAAIERRKQHDRDLLKKLQDLDRSKLSPDQQLNYDLYLYGLKQGVEGQQFPQEYVQISQMGGVYSELAELAIQSPRRTVKDYEDFLKRMEATPVLVEQTIALLKKGAETGVTPPSVTLREVEGLIGNQITEDVVTSPIYDIYFKNLPDTIPAAEQKRLRERGEKILREKVIPSFVRFRDFYVSEYVPKTRQSIGLAEVPNGRAWYAYRVKVMTTTDLTPDQIHEIGLSEVKRIRGEMEKIKTQTGFKGSLQEFFNFLRTDPQFFFTDEKALLKEYRDIAKRIDPELTRMFGTLPRLPYGVLPVPDFSEKTQTTAYYQAGSPEAGRPGYFYANLYNLAARPKWEMEALTAHEAVPGHHLQIALAQEMQDVPNFRKYEGYTAFVEGWGLYSESLGPELGLYKDLYSKFGQLTYEMWRAIRLVVDTGMHSRGWTREQAINFFKENSSKSEHDITVEVDRYIVWPGQALAYKLGELKIKELRALATRELGEKFDIRKFHDVVLGAGALPLAILEQRVKNWIASQKT